MLSVPWESQRFRACLFPSGYCRFCLSRLCFGAMHHPKPPQVSSSMFPAGEAALRLWLSLAVGLRERYGLPLLEALADLPQLMIRSIQEVRKKGGDLPIKPGGTCLPHYSFTTDPPKLSTPRLRSRPHSCASHICWACRPPRLPGCWFIPTGARRGDAREPDEA